MHRTPLSASVSSIVAVVIFALISFVPVQAQDSTSAPASSTGEATVETLLDTTIEELPIGRARVALDRWRLRPSTRPLVVPALGGPVIVAVESGTLAVSAAGAERRVEPGAFVILSGAEPVAFSPADSEEIIASAVYIVPSGFSGEGWDSDPMAHFFDYPIDDTADSLPGGAGRVLVERITLPPGGALPPQEVSPLIWWGITEGRAGITLEGERLPFRWESGEERAFAGGESLPFIAPGTRMTFRNVEDRPVVLYRLTLTSENETGAAGTPAAGTPVA